MYVFRRGSLYLSNRYTWQAVPDLFPEWHAQTVLEVMQQPMEIAVVDEKQVIDLDAVEWTAVR